MSQFGNWIAVIAALLIANGCSRTPELARGPIQVAESPTSVRFVQPVPSSGSAWELCFEFDRPGDSHHADDIRAVLLSADGQRHPLAETRLDRR